MNVLFDFFANNPIAFWIVFWIILILIISLLALTILAFKQGRQITILRIINIGPRVESEKPKDKIPSNLPMKVDCDCELKDLIYLCEDGSTETMINKWSYEVSNCILSLDHPLEKATLEFDIDIRDDEDYRSQFRYYAFGPFDGVTAFLEYSINEINRKNRRWRGTTIVRIPKSGPIYGYWLTTGLLSHNRICLGSIHLTRK